MKVSITTLGIGAACHIDDHGMDHVSEMTQLESLNLNGLHITDTGLRKLDFLQNLKLLEPFTYSRGRSGSWECRFYGSFTSLAATTQRNTL